jgi:hypothetical protein
VGAVAGIVGSVTFGSRLAPNLAIGAALLAMVAGCAPEITRVAPTRVAPDAVVVVEGKRMSDKIAVSIAGGPIPVSGLELTQKKDKVGRFSFRMPVSDAAGSPLGPGSYEASIRVGGTTKRVQIDMTDRASPPQPRAAQVAARLTPEGEGTLTIGGTTLRWPLKVRVVPIVPHGDEFGFALEELKYKDDDRIDILLPYGMLQLSSYRVYIQNSSRYGGKWSEPAVAVYKP